MHYSVSNSDAVEEAVRNICYVIDQLTSISEMRSSGLVIVAALDELQAKVDEQTAYIEQVEASYSQMMRSLDEVEAEAKGT